MSKLTNEKGVGDNIIGERERICHWRAMKTALHDKIGENMNGADKGYAAVLRLCVGCKFGTVQGYINCGCPGQRHEHRHRARRNDQSEGGGDRYRAS
jgi:ATP-dependent helicase YprA (DUF1998 family)